MANEENGILSSEETEQVTGGIFEEHKHTLMHCDECEYETIWEGDFMDDLNYPCEDCGEVWMHGIQYV